MTTPTGEGDDHGPRAGQTALQADPVFEQLTGAAALPWPDDLPDPRGVEDDEDDEDDG